ncbi:MAG: RHS repeat-associated core domain-containing protein, partial [Chitinophagales bacterium]|nr:RHS repeat-associated core domain-containing protein [Chitinophagales bacterium]
YIGKERDEESGLYQMGARYYAPWTCKFLSVDPLAVKLAHQSSYCYADNNPIMLKDPSGMQTKAQGNPKPAEEGKAINLTTFEWSNGVAPGGEYGITSGDKVGNTHGPQPVNKAPSPPPSPSDKVTRMVGAKPFNPDKPMEPTNPGVPVTHTQQEWDNLDQAVKEGQANPEIAVTDLYGIGQIGPKNTVEANIQKQNDEYKNRIGELVASGPGASIGYYFGGERGAQYGAIADAVSMGAHFTPLKPQSLKIESAPLNTFRQGEWISKVEYLRATTGQNSTPVSVKKNIAYAAGEINGEKYFSPGISGETHLNPDAAPTNLQNRYFNPEKGHDAEALLIEQFTGKYSNGMAVNPNVTGSLQIVSERPICGKCMEKIRDVSVMFPNVKFSYISGVY